MFLRASSAPETVHANEPERDEILRFRLSERQMHWAVALPFMVCYVTALVLIFVYNPNPQRPYRALVSWVHRVSGLSLLILPIGVLLRHWYDRAMHVHNVREVWAWTLDDLKWLALIGPATLIKRICLPDQGKFNAAEKINFMVLTATFPLYVISGLLIWSHHFAFLAWLLHLSMAATATPLLFGHVFMATVNPDTRVGLSGMVTGFVDRHWASHHYGHWYKANFAPPFVVAESDAPAVLLDPSVALAPGRTDGEGFPAASWPPPADSVSHAPLWDCHVGDLGVDDAARVAAADMTDRIVCRLQPDRVSAEQPDEEAGTSFERGIGLGGWVQPPLPSFRHPPRPRGRTDTSWPPPEQDDAVDQLDRKIS